MDRAELRERIWQVIEDEWHKSRPPGGAGTTHSITVYERLVAQGIDVPPGAMNEILTALHNEELIRAPGFLGGEDAVALHGNRAIIEPKWRLYE